MQAIAATQRYDTIDPALRRAVSVALTFPAICAWRRRGTKRATAGSVGSAAQEVVVAHAA